ncbi:MAG: integrase family protein [Gammaproteobacteria bacterium]|nr:integrase family protein [Gammaproteobacteria bacterium]
MRKLLNQRVADSAKPEARPYEVRDTAITGLILRVQPTGAKTWKLIQNRKPRTLGRMPVMTHGMAAEKAMAILRGEDPDAAPEPEPELPEALTFDLFLDRHYWPYLRSHHSRPEESLRCLKRFGLGDKELVALRLADVETWRIERRRKGRSDRTINRDTATLKAALERAVEWELLPENPLRRLKPLKTDKRGVVRYLHGEEATRLLAALSARDTSIQEARESANRWRAERGYELLPKLGPYADNLTPLVIVALNTGLRRGELWNLAWGDVDLKRGTLTVSGQGAKSKQTRHVPLNASATAALKAHKGDVTPLPSLPVFGRHEFKTAFAAVLKDAGLEDFRFHDCRHHADNRIMPNRAAGKRLAALGRCLESA